MSFCISQGFLEEQNNKMMHILKHFVNSALNLLHLNGNQLAHTRDAEDRVDACFLRLVPQHME